MSYRLTETERKYISIIDDLFLAIKKISNVDGTDRDLALEYSDGDYTKTNSRLTVLLPRYSTKYNPDDNKLSIVGTGSDSEGVPYVFNTAPVQPGWVYDIKGEFVKVPDFTGDYITKLTIDILNKPGHITEEIPLDKFYEIDVVKKFSWYGYEVQNPSEIIEDPACEDEVYVLKLYKNGPVKPSRVVWEPEFKLLKVTFISELLENIFQNTQLVEKNTAISKPVPDPTCDSHDFINWYAENTLTNLFNFSTPITVNTDVYAKWAMKEYTVNYFSNSKPLEGIFTGPVKVLYDQSIPRPISSWENDYQLNSTSPIYVFDDWYYENTFDNIAYFDTYKGVFPEPGRTITLYANWTLKEIEIEFNLNGGTSAAIPKQYILSGEKAIIPTTPTLDDHDFEYWYISDPDEEFDFNDPIYDDLTLTAKWKLAAVPLSIYYGYFIPKGSVTGFGWFDPAYTITIGDIEEAFNNGSKSRSELPTGTTPTDDHYFCELQNETVNKSGPYAKAVDFNNVLGYCVFIAPASFGDTIITDVANTPLYPPASPTGFMKDTMDIGGILYNVFWFTYPADGGTGGVETNSMFKYSFN